MAGRLILPEDRVDGLGAIGELRRGMEAILGGRHIVPEDDWTNDVLAFVYVALALGVDYPATARAMRRTMDGLLGAEMATLSTQRARGMAVAAGDPSARR